MSGVFGPFDPYLGGRSTAGPPDGPTAAEEEADQARRREGCQCDHTCALPCSQRAGWAPACVQCDCDQFEDE